MISKKSLFSFVLLLVLTLFLTACQAYNGYPTVEVQATPEGTTKAQATSAPRPTIPPPPTFTPRPALQTTPSGVQLQKTKILKQGLDTLKNNYFQKLSNSDLYEVALLSIRNNLELGGISNPDVPLPQFGNQDSDNWNLFLQVYSLVLSKYKGQVNEDNLVEFALGGVANSVQDCQTSYYTIEKAESYAQTRFGTNQSLVGIGINLQTGQDNSGGNVHLITRAIAGGPAEKAGIKAGDRIIKVDGQETKSKTSTEVVQLIAGPVRGNSAIGTKVKLTIQRGNQEQNVELARAQISIPFMEQQTLPGNIGYIKFSRFPILAQQANNYIKQVQTWVSNFEKADVKGIVLDLRGNNAGSITLVQNILSLFLEGDELVYLSGAERKQNSDPDYGVITFANNPSLKATTKPISVLVDAGTSGEAEIFAHAIQRNKRGAVVGVATSGCPNASVPIVLDDNSLINVTTYRAIANADLPESILTPIVPDKAVQLDLSILAAQGKDSQLEEAIKALTK